MENLGLIILIICIVQIVLSIFIYMKLQAKANDNSNILIQNEITNLREELKESLEGFGNTSASNAKQIYEMQKEHLELLAKSLQEKSEHASKILNGTLDNVDKSLKDMQAENNRKLDEMRNIVDEKLQKTLNDRMTESFKQVSDRLEQVHKGLGEMQTLAQGVGDLKKVMSNVKSRGILGEIQLGAILEEILSSNQYEKEIPTKKGSADRVEYAVKLPVEDGFIYLPIDAKFPGDTYGKLRDAYENGDPAEIETAAKALVAVLKSEAKDISSKYIDPPHTTDFAVMFLPFEGLYAEAVNRGMIEILQKDYHVNLAGPSTMAALLNSLQMGFRTVAIQKRSGEVWKVLSAVKTEFGKFENSLKKTQEHLRKTNNELDNLVGTRTRMMQSKLRSLSELDSVESEKILELDKPFYDDEDEK